MSISPVFMYAPVPLTDESPLAHAVEIHRRHREQNPAAVAVPRPRFSPNSKKETRKISPAAKSGIGQQDAYWGIPA
jgi:hypothetical protein